MLQTDCVRYDNVFLIQIQLHKLFLTFSCVFKNDYGDWTPNSLYVHRRKIILKVVENQNFVFVKDWCKKRVLMIEKVSIAFEYKQLY